MAKEVLRFGNIACRITTPERFQDTLSQPLTESIESVSFGDVQSLCQLRITCLKLLYDSISQGRRTFS